MSRPNKSLGWTLWELFFIGLQVSLSFVAVTILVSGVAVLILLGPELLQQQDISTSIIRNSLQDHVFLVNFLIYLLWLPLLVFLLGRYFGKSQPGEGWLSRLDLSRPTWRDIAAGIAMSLALTGLVTIIGVVLDWLGLVDISQRQVLLKSIPGGGWNLLWALMMIGLLVPLAEELVFRRWLYRSLVDWAGVGLALPLAALAFGLLHSDSLAIAISATVLGAGFILAYRWSGNLWTSIVMHATNNIMVISLVSLGYVS